MTISSILGFRGASSTTASPASLGPYSHRAPSFHNAQHRGDIWIHSDGWKGGNNKKGDSAALSALTLLAFLFFLNILQSCLQDMNNQPTVVVANGGARREEVPTMVAVPMETPMAMPMPMQPMQPVQARSKRGVTKRSVPVEEQARHLQRVQQQQKKLVKPDKTDKEAKEDQPRHIDVGSAGWEVVSVSEPVNKQQNQRYKLQPLRQTPQDVGAGLGGLGDDHSTPVMVEVGLAPRVTGTAAPHLAVQDDEDVDERVVSITPAPVRAVSKRPLSADVPAMVRVSSSSSNSFEAQDEDSVVSESTEPVANKQEEYDLAATTERIETATVSGVPVAVPVAMVPMRPAVHFVPLASTFRGVFSMLAAPLLRMVQPGLGGLGGLGGGSGLGAALTAGLGQGLREGLRSAMCCDLVVCEAQRLGRIGGTLGERVATTVSSVMRWVCGDSDELKAAVQRGRAAGGEGCRVHIEQCERRAGRRTAVTTIASLLEAYVTGGRP